MVAVFHQLHCIVRYMAREGYCSALEGNIDQVSEAHLTDCFNYLGQTIICFGDTTLEWLPAPLNDIWSSGDLNINVATSMRYRSGPRNVG